MFPWPWALAGVICLTVLLESRRIKSSNPTERRLLRIAFVIVLACLALIIFALLKYSG